MNTWVPHRQTLVQVVRAILLIERQAGMPRGSLLLPILTAHDEYEAKNGEYLVVISEIKKITAKETRPNERKWKATDDEFDTIMESLFTENEIKTLKELYGDE